jgi:prepilin peptidase CpaA
VNLVAEAPLWLALIFAVLVVAAGLQDAMQARMSNKIVLLVIAGAVIAAAVLGPQIELWQNLTVFAFLLTVGTVMFAKGVLGGGDVKVLAATSLWFNLVGGAKMLLAVFASGGVLALLVIVARLANWSEGAQQRFPFLRPGAGVPYGVAIAAGALIAATLQW